MTELPFEKCFHTRSQGFLGLIQDFILSYCLAVTYTRSHVIVMIDIRSFDDNINDQCSCHIVWGCVFPEVFRMRAVLFRTAGQGMRIRWSVFYRVINQWLKNLVLEICIYCFCYSNL